MKALDEVVRAGDDLAGALREKQKALLEDCMTARRGVNVPAEGQMREIRKGKIIPCF